MKKKKLKNRIKKLKKKNKRLYKKLKLEQLSNIMIAEELKIVKRSAEDMTSDNT